MNLPLAWLHLKSEPVRLLAAVAGVSFAVVLVFVQLALKDALLDSAVRLHAKLRGDIVLVSPRSLFLAAMLSFPRRRLYQAAGIADVEGVSAIRVHLSTWKNPLTSRIRVLLVVGINPARAVLDLPEVSAQLWQLHLPNRALFDRDSRPEFGPIPELLERTRALRTEVADREVVVSGLFRLGTSFGFDGLLLTSDLNFLHLFPDHRAELMEIGLVRLARGADPVEVAERIRAVLPPDVEVLTKAEYVQRERDYWSAATPIGFVFTFGSVMGLVIGGVIAYQILFTNIGSHLPEFATLKAIGYTNRFLTGVVLRESLILSVLGFLPAFVLSFWLYSIIESGTHLPMRMTYERAVEVLAFTVVMCVSAGTMALRKLRQADAAELF